MYFLSKRQNGHAQKRQRAVDKQNAGLSGMDEWVDKEGGSTLFRLGASGFHLCCAPPVGLLAPRRGRQSGHPTPAKKTESFISGKRGGRGHQFRQRKVRAQCCPRAHEQSITCTYLRRARGAKRTACEHGARHPVCARTKEDACARLTHAGRPAPARGRAAAHHTGLHCIDGCCIAAAVAGAPYSVRHCTPSR